MDEYIKGAFFGAFIICVFMLNFSEPTVCEVTQLYSGNRVHVSYGITK